MPNTGPDIPAADAVHVAVGVVVDRDRRILIARRHADAHQGGLWEFPGGKVGKDETVRAALVRELREEVNLTVRECARMLRIAHDYGDKRVLLDVWYVGVFSGEAAGCEGQPVKWVTAAELDAHEFPQANREIVAAVKSLLDPRDP